MNGVAKAKHTCNYIRNTQHFQLSIFPFFCNVNSQPQLCLFREKSPAGFSFRDLHIVYPVMVLPPLRQCMCRNPKRFFHVYTTLLTGNALYKYKSTKRLHFHFVKDYHSKTLHKGMLEVSQLKSSMHASSLHEWYMELVEVLFDKYTFLMWWGKRFNTRGKRIDTHY